MVELFDVALVHDEVSLAEFRVRYYESLVTKHFFFEASHTHSGIPKASHLQQSEFLTNSPKVALVQFEIPDQVLRKGNRWAIEEYSRDWAMTFVAERHPQAVFMLADVDEVPSLPQLEAARDLAYLGRLAIPLLETSYRYVNWVAPEKWKAVRVLHAERARPGVRFLPGRTIAGEMGSHLRYIGYDMDQIGRKHRAFAHKELDAPRFRSKNYLDWCDRLALSHVPRFEWGESGALKCLAEESLGHVRESFYRAHLVSFSHHRPLYSSVRRQVAYYWLCRWAKGETPVSLDELMSQVLSGWSIAFYRGLFSLVFQKTRVPQSMRVLTRAFGFFVSPKVKGRLLVHHLRGVYRFGNQVS